MNTTVTNSSTAPTNTSSSTTAGGGQQTPYNPATYSEYYRQYMQYIYLYGNAAAYAGYQQPSSQTSSFMTQQTNTIIASTVNSLKLNNPPPPPPPPPSDAQPQGKPNTIKFNLKFQQQQQPKLLVPQIKQQQQQQQTQADTYTPRASVNKTPNIAQQQSLYQQYQQKQKEKLAASSTSSPQQPQQQQQTIAKAQLNESVTANDIISDINKWPVSLKNYCSRLFQIYSSNKSVSEQQVTQYLQNRITEAFKIKSDLSINWDNEKIPDVQTIKQVLAQTQTAVSKPQQQQQQQPQQYNQVPPPSPKQTTPKTQQSLLPLKPRSVDLTQQPRTPFKQYILNQQLKLKDQQQEQQVSNHKRKSKSKSPSSDKSSSSSSSSAASLKLSANKKFKKDQPKVVSSKIKRNLSDDDEDDEEEDEDEDYDDDKEDSYKSENDEEMSDEDFKPLSKRQQKKLNKVKNMKFEIKNNTINSKKLNNRAQRFQIEALGTEKKKFGRIISFFNQDSNSNLVQTRIVGTSQELEKEYLRLTGAPEPSNVRPLNVLKQSLDYILDKYSKTNDYRYVCDQLKAIRQDLTVQMIRNEFTIQVYETHARIAIMKCDRDEFNQCQSQLMNLYETVHDEKATKNADEFIGYRLLYYILTKSYKDLNRIIIEIKRKYNDNLYLNHLLKFRSAWHLNNYVMLFKLYKKSNQMSKYLIDLFIERERKLALKMIIKSYRPYVKLDIIKELLAYESINKCKEDLLSYGLCITTSETEDNNNNLVLDCKSSNIQNL